MLAVSIVTVSQYSRIPFLRILAECIKKQDYCRIIEWVIIDASKGDHDLEEIITEFKNLFKLTIIYQKSSGKFIGSHRNLGNTLVRGDIVVCCDDDDYYPTDRVTHAVDKLEDKKCLIAGCDKIILYDIFFKHMYQYNGITSNHSTNNCMAYWREYGINHRYDESVRNAEENSFTNDFKEPMVQLDPYKTVLQFSHDENTYNKRKIILTNLMVPPEKRYITKLEKTPEEFINDKKISDKYQKIFDEKTIPKECEYDIVYYCGALSVAWSPLDKGLGGSEQAVKHLSSEWAKMGKKVVVYANLKVEGKYEGVDYYDCCKFRFWDKFKTLILWRLYGVIPFITFDLKTDKLLVDLHDNDIPVYQMLAQPDNNKKITKWLIKSEFQKNVIEASTNKKLSNLSIIPNGIRIDNFINPTEDKRNPFRFCYCSCYTRGLNRILKDIWPIIYEFEPKAELHVYYGMDMVTDQKFKDDMRMLLGQPGVMDHGRQPLEMVNREKHLSTFHFYYTDGMAETDCISVRESLVAKCIPIISNSNVFAERDGVKITWVPNLPGYNRTIACGIVELMNNEKGVEELREKFSKSTTIISWKQVAEKWIEFM